MEEKIDRKKSLRAECGSDLDYGPQLVRFPQCTAQKTKFTLKANKNPIQNMSKAEWHNLRMSSPFQIHFLIQFFSVSLTVEGNSINCAIQSNHSFAKCAWTLQVLELTDALAVNSTAVRLEWHLLLSDTEYYIEVIYWNNLIDFAIRLLKHSLANEDVFLHFAFNRACTFDTGTWAANLQSTTV